MGAAPDPAGGVKFPNQPVSRPMTPVWAEDIAELTQENAELRHMVDVLKGALAAAHVEAIPAPAPWMAEMTPACRVLIGALYAAKDRILTREYLVKILPGRSDPEDRFERSIDTIVKRTRKHLPKGAIINHYGLGFELSPAFRNSIPQQGLETDEWIKLS